MTSKKTKGPLERVVDAISDFMGKPLSDASYELPTAKTVREAKASARRIGTAKKKRASGKKRASKGGRSKRR